MSIIRGSTIVTQSFAPEFGYQETFFFTPSPDSNVYQEKVPKSVRSHLLFDETATFRELNRKINTTHTIQIIPIKEEAEITKESLPEETMPLFVRRADESIEFITQITSLVVSEGDQLVVLALKEA